MSLANDIENLKRCGTLDVMEAVIKAFETQYIGKPCTPHQYYAPSRFTPDEHAILIPLEEAAGLPHYEDRLRSTNARVAFSFLPVWWQLDSIAFMSHDKFSIPHATVDPRHLPVAIEIVRQLQPTMVLTSHELALTLATNLIEKKIPVPAHWHIVEPITSHRQTSIPFAAIVSTEFHLVPGVSFAYQCHNNCVHPSPIILVDSWHEDTREKITEVVSRHSSPSSCPCGNRVELSFTHV
ncbi:hypothetical protein EBR66_06270 [bacterium]|nr:hypothetical protein [bacterium]